VRPLASHQWVRSAHPLRGCSWRVHEAGGRMNPRACCMSCRRTGVDQPPAKGSHWGVRCLGPGVFGCRLLFCGCVGGSVCLGVQLLCGSVGCWVCLSAHVSCG
jgi:hypothetical protein